MASAVNLAHVHRERMLQEISPRSRFSKGSEGIAVATDAVSLGRNSLITTSAFKGSETAAKLSPAIGGLVLTGGILAFLGGGAITKSGLSGMSTAYRRGNWEAGVSSASLTTAGAAYSVVGAGMITAQSASYASAASAAAVGTSMFIGGAFGLYGAVGIYATYNMAINAHFRHQLNKALKGPGSEKERLAAALEWLHGQTQGGSPAELEKKWDQLASRTSETCCRYIRQKVDAEFIEKVREGDTVALGHARWIVQEVKRENNKQLVKNSLLIGIVALGIAAVVLELMFAAGPFSPLLFAIGAVMWLFFDSSVLQKKFGDFFCGASQLPEISRRDVDKYKPLDPNTMQS